MSPAMRPVPAGALGRFLACVALLLAILAQSVQGAAPTSDGQKYLMISLPSEAKIVYFKLPDTTPRTLLASGMNTPTSIAWDAANSRLFIADIPDENVKMVSVIALADGKLVPAGTVGVGATNVEANNIAVDMGGNLYLTGQAKLKPPYTGLTKMGVFKKPWDKIEVGKKKIKGNGIINGPLVFQPSGIITDGFNLYWGNSVGGSTHGTVNKAGMGGGGATAIADNSVGSFGLCVSERNVFFGTPDGIYGMAKTHTTSGCGKDNCKLITPKLTSAASMQWDGDGTIYILNTDDNGIYIMPSGNLEPHHVEKIGEIGDPTHSIALMQLAGGNRGGAATTSLAASVLGIVAAAFVLA